MYLVILQKYLEKQRCAALIPNKARDTLETLGAQDTPRTCKQLKGF